MGAPDSTPYTLPRLTRDHIALMSVAGRADAVLDWKQQISYIAFSTTRAGVAKRRELQARIDYACSLDTVLP